MSGEQPYVYVVYRLDEEYLDKLPKELAAHVYEDDSRWRQSPWDLLLKVKEVFMEEEHARAEVERLNKLNAEKGCRYFWQGAKFYPEGRKAQR